MPWSTGDTTRANSAGFLKHFLSKLCHQSILLLETGYRPHAPRANFAWSWFLSDINHFFRLACNYLDWLSNSSVAIFRRLDACSILNRSYFPMNLSCYGTVIDSFRPHATHVATLQDSWKQLSEINQLFRMSLFRLVVELSLDDWIHVQSQ